MAQLSNSWINRRHISSIMPSILNLLIGGVLLLLAACTPHVNKSVETEVPNALTGVYGTVTDQAGAPVSDAFIYAYRVPAKNMRGPADYAIRTEGDGSYILDLPSEPFHLVARHRQTGENSGPPRQGDVWAPSPQNPVIIKPAQPIKVNFILSSSTTPSLQTIPHLSSGSAGFSGVVTTKQGDPLRGIEVLAYSDRNIQRVPDFRGEPSNHNGLFKIFLPEGETFCLVLRERIKGQPRLDELFAVIKEGENCLNIKAGTIKNLEEVKLQPYGAR